MIQIKRITKLSDEHIAELTPEAKKEWSVTFIRTFPGKGWEVRYNEMLLFTFGVYEATLIGLEPLLWILPTMRFNKITPKILKCFRRGFRRLLKVYKNLVVFVDKTFTKAARFVEAFGFKFVKVLDQYQLYKAAS